MSKLVKSSLAKSAQFNHKNHADRLEKLNTQAQAARRVDVALGLFCYELKEIHLQSGQFGKWLAEHRPSLARQHKNGSWQPSASLESAMWMAKSALEVCGYQIGDYIALTQKHFPLMSGKSNETQLMLLPEAKLPEEFKALRDEIFKLVDGKSERQMRSEFKQISEETGKPARGRLPGCKGTSAEQRALAAEAAEQAALEELTISAGEQADWALEKADDKNLGTLDEATLTRLYDAWTNGARYISNVLAARKGGAK